MMRSMGILYRYVLIVFACAAVLVGVQLPNFVDQYRHRLDAHLREVSTNLQGWQNVADRYFKASLQALLDYHAASPDPVFRAEADPLRELMARQARFTAETGALNEANLAQQLLYLASRGDRELLGETRNGYSVTVPLDGRALISGFVTAATALIVLECLFAVPRWLFRRTGAPRRMAGSRR
ncbi:DUF2937 family protein [soil metagenome]